MGGTVIAVRVLRAVAVVALVMALAYFLGNVQQPDGGICGRPWRAAGRTIDFSGGDRTDADRAASADACAEVGVRALRIAAVCAAVAVAAAAGASATRRYADRRSHSA